MNDCKFTGYLLEKPELKSSPSGKPVCEFRMNVPRDYKSSTGERLSDFISVVAWGRTAEIIAENCDKGTKLIISTHVRTELYTDKQGVKRESHKYEVDRFEFAERKASQASQSVAASSGMAGEPQEVSDVAGIMPEQPAPNYQTLSNDEELPF